MFDLVGLGGPAAVIIIAAFVVIIGLSVWWSISRRRKREASGVFDKKASTETLARSVGKAPEGGKDAGTSEVPRQSLIGTGNIKAMVFTYNGDIDFTTIPEPVGNIYQFDTSCPFSGGGYIVKEGKNGEIIDYDPREVEIVTEELPEWAWFAINCKEIVKRFWQVPQLWWHSVSMWFAAGMILVVFISFLAVFGG